MEYLITEKNLINVQENEKCALSGQLVCNCGCDQFEILHTGKEKKCFLFPPIVKNKNQLIIKARCSKCGAEITIYEHKGTQNDFKMFKLKNGNSIFKIMMYYNYFEKNFKENGHYTNNYQNCFIDAVTNKKRIRIVEE